MAADKWVFVRVLTQNIYTIPYHVPNLLQEFSIQSKLSKCVCVCVRMHVNKVWHT